MCLSSRLGQFSFFQNQCYILGTTSVIDRTIVVPGTRVIYAETLGRSQADGGQDRENGNTKRLHHPSSITAKAPAVLHPAWCRQTKQSSWWRESTENEKQNENPARSSIFLFRTSGDPAYLFLEKRKARNTKTRSGPS